MGEGPSRTLIACALAAVAVAGGVGLGVLGRPVAPAPLPTVSAVDGIPAPMVEVHVAGWVMRPGVVSLPEHAIVADAIDAAGGLRPGAAVETINLAASVRDGDQVVVPGPGDVPGGGGPATHGDGVISLNRATVTDLERLPGVGPVLAERIVAHRDQVGGFDSVDDLLEVPGIGEAKLAAIRDLVRP